MSNVRHPDQPDDDDEETSKRRTRPIKPLGTARRPARSRTPTPNNPHPQSPSQKPSTSRTPSIEAKPSPSSSFTRRASTNRQLPYAPWLPFLTKAEVEQQEASSSAWSSSSSSRLSVTSSLASDISSADLISFVRQRRAMSAEPEEWSQSAQRGRSFNRLSNGRPMDDVDVVVEERLAHETSKLQRPSFEERKESSSESTTSSSSTSKSDSDEEKERAHFQTVLKAFDTYLPFSLAANNARRRSFYALPRSHRLLLSTVGSALPGPILGGGDGGSSNDSSTAVSAGRGFKARLDEIDDRIRRNADVLSIIVQDSRTFLDNDGVAGDEKSRKISDEDRQEAGRSSDRNAAARSRKPSRSKAAAANHNVDKVRSTIKQFVRDWSTLGAQERQAAYQPILDALTQLYAHLSAQQRSQNRVLVPGAGLGRLAFDIAWHGFSCQGNEFSFYMLLASHFVLNKSSRIDEHVLYPFVHSSSNWRTAADMLRPVRIPDVNPSDLPSDVDFSMVAGEFVEVYGKDGERGRWNAVATCFFIDTARNFARYVEVINHVLPLDGVWINVGPLLWHYEGGGQGDISIELTMEEVVELIELMGFVVERRATLARQPYTGNAANMLTYEYAPEFWQARKVRDVSKASDV